WVADNGQKSKYQEMALINLLLSLEKDLPSDNELSKRIGKSLNKVEFGKAEKKFENAAKKYVDNFPKGEKVVDVKFKLARLYYAFNHLDEALALFKEIVEKHSNTQNAQYSANLI